MKTALTLFGDSVSLEEAILGFDWSATPLGHPSDWPQSLRSIVALIVSSGKPMFIVWGSTRTLIYNDAYAALLGPKHPSALGAPFFSVWPDSVDDAAPLFDRLFGGTVLDMEDISISFDREAGSPESHFALSYTPIRDRGNKVVGLLCIHSDTAEPKAGKVLQRRDHKRLAQMFEQAPSFIAVLNGPDHRVELANAGLLKLVDERRQIIGKTVREAMPDAVAQGYLTLLDQAFATGERVVRTGARYAVGLAPGVETKECFVDFVFQPITDGIGHVTGIFVHGTDVTERVREEMALRDRETHLHEENADLGRLVTERSAQLLAKEALIRTVYEHSSEFHVVVAQVPEGAFRLEEINPAALRFYEGSRQQLIGRTVAECFKGAEAAVINAHLAACLKADAAYPFEFVYDGSVIEGTATPLPAVLGTGRQIAISARDATERRNLEEQLRQSQKMEAVGQLTGGLAHDFNNLLSGISGSLELLKTRKDQGRLNDLDRYIAAAQGAAHRAAALTHRLLAFARRQTLDARSTDVNSLVAGMDELVRRTVGPTIHVAIVSEKDLWSAWVDPNQLESALLNLCINARDAMPNGGRLFIETGNHSLDDHAAMELELSPGQYLSLSVTDTGIGMSTEVMARAFEPFFTTKPIGEGTGLGLSMIYGFARQSGGRVIIRSVIGQGTKVSVYLPRHHGGAELDEPTASSNEPLRAGRGEMVLIVDDEPTVRMLVAEVVSEMGYRTIEAHDGIEGLKLLQSGQRVDLLVTDIGLPGGLDGMQLGEAARAYRAGLRILFITGYADLPRGVTGHGEAGRQCLKKPFSIQELATRISALMRHD